MRCSLLYFTFSSMLAKTGFSILSVRGKNPRGMGREFSPTTSLFDTMKLRSYFVAFQERCLSQAGHNFQEGSQNNQFPKLFNSLYCSYLKATNLIILFYSTLSRNSKYSNRQEKWSLAIFDRFIFLTLLSDSRFLQNIEAFHLQRYATADQD